MNLPIEFLPISMDDNWQVIFDTIEENFHRIALYILNQLTTLRIEQFEGDERTNDFHLEHTITDETSLIIFRNDDMYAEGKTSAYHNIENNVLHLTVPLEKDEGLTIHYIESNFLMGATNYLTEEIAKKQDQIDKMFAEASELYELTKPLRPWIEKRSVRYGEIIGHEDITAYAPTVTEAIRNLFLDIASKEDSLSDEQKKALDRIVQWNTATDEEVEAQMREIFEKYTQEASEEMQTLMELCTRLADECAKLKEAVDADVLSARSSEASVAETLTLIRNLLIQVEKWANTAKDWANGTDDPESPAYGKSAKDWYNKTRFTRLENLDDVDIDFPSSNQTIVWSDAKKKWVNQDIDMDISTRVDNIIEHKSDGLFAPTPNLNPYVKKEDGKGLSECNFTLELRTKLEALNEGGEKNKLDQVAVNGSFVPIYQMSPPYDPSTKYKTADIELSTYTDKALDSSSNNAVANAPVANAINSQQTEVNNAVAKLGGFEFRVNGFNPEYKPAGGVAWIPFKVDDIEWKVGFAEGYYAATQVDGRTATITRSYHRHTDPSGNQSDGITDDKQYSVSGGCFTCYDPNTRMYRRSCLRYRGQTVDAYTIKYKFPKRY